MNFLKNRVCRFMGKSENKQKLNRTEEISEKFSEKNRLKVVGKLGIHKTHKCYKFVVLLSGLMKNNQSMDRLLSSVTIVTFLVGFGLFFEL